MTFKFKAKIYKVGINPCVKVPLRITKLMIPLKGYIPIQGKIKNHNFIQTLVPVKGEGYRLYVNGPMLKGSGTTLGDMVNFEIKQDVKQKNRMPLMNKMLEKELKENNLLESFEKLIPSRRKDILRYLNNLKSQDTLIRNVDKVIKALRGIEPSPLFRI
jgi:hypothetical protein